MEPGTGSGLRGNNLHRVKEIWGKLPIFHIFPLMVPSIMTSQTDDKYTQTLSAAAISP